MLHRNHIGFAVSMLGAFALIRGASAGAQPPSKEDARKILGPRGGTVLVYEIDRRRKTRDYVGEGAEKLLAEMLTRRLVPNKLYEVTVRPAGKNRVEILLRAKDQRPEAKARLAEEVKRVKKLVSSTGTLEFCILANNYDDSAAIKDAKAMIANPSNKKVLEDLRDKGLPPPPPTVNGRADGKPKEFALTRLPRGSKSKVTYRWVELGEPERQTLNLNNAAKNAPGGNRAWLDMAAARDAGKAVELSWSNDPSGRKLLHGALFYSRKCTDRNLPEEVRRKKKVEYFVLARNPEIDPATAKETPAIDGSYLSAVVSEKIQGRPAIMFALNKSGAALFRNLTRKNVPSGSAEEASQVRRHLAILFDGLVMAAPTINSEIGQRGMISGNFTKEKVDTMTSILRAGALPVPLQPRPVVEITLGPASK